MLKIYGQDIIFSFKQLINVFNHGVIEFQKEAVFATTDLMRGSML
jgi:hypothetical protein